MAHVQSYFEQFHKVIRADYDMNATLREKRDIVLGMVSDYLKGRRYPAFSVIHQGSYKMRTGVKPIGALEFDIDVGLRFETAETAIVVRDWIRAAVKDHTKSTEARRACIRVNYEAGYHLDLVVYRVPPVGQGQELLLGHRDRGWVPADPIRLNAFVDARALEQFWNTDDSATNTDQLRRCVRYLRRWDDVALPSETAAKPCGLAFALYAIAAMGRATDSGGRPDDAVSLRGLADAAATNPARISVSKPTPEYEDVFSKLSDSQMAALKKRFTVLRDALDFAMAEPDPVEACSRLRAEFGDDFPVPPKDKTGKVTSGPAIISTSHSGSQFR